MTSGHPFVKAALTCLSRRWPMTVTFSELWDMVRAQLLSGPEPFPLEEDIDEGVLAETVLECYSRGVIVLRTHQPALAVDVSDRPLASPLAHLQARTESSVANLLHCEISLSPLERRIIQCLDGNCHRREIADQLSSIEITENTETDSTETPNSSDAAEVSSSSLDEQIRLALARFAASALLMVNSSTE